MNRLTLRQIIKRMIIETYEEFNHPVHIIVIIDQVDKEKISLITEGDWRPSSEKGYWQRLDTPNFDFEQLHVHIAKQKYINAKNKQVSWNKDGTRHDKKSFNQNFNGMETAKRIARNALDLPLDFQLEIIQELKHGELLLENIENLPSKTSVYIFKLKSQDNQILKS